MVKRTSLAAQHLNCCCVVHVNFGTSGGLAWRLRQFCDIIET
jgi:hypothetical protein